MDTNETIFSCRCHHGTLKINNGMLIIAKGCFMGNAWMVPFASITGIEIGNGFNPHVWLQAPGGGFHTKIPLKDAQRLQELHAQMLMQRSK